MAKGPQTNFTRDARGNVINGLRVQKTKDQRGRSIDRYYSIKTNGGRKYFGNSQNRADAIRRYRKWQAEVSRDTIAIGAPIDDLEEFLRAIPSGDEFTITIHSDGTVTDESDVAADAFWGKVAEEIRRNPRLAAQETGIEELAYLDHLKPPPPSLSLLAVGQLYLEDKLSEITPAEWRNSRTWWNEFCTLTDSTSVADLDRAAFHLYRNAILSEVKKRQLSNAWARSRFGKIKTIIQHAVTELDLNKEDRATLTLCSLLKQPPKPAPNPVDITPPELRQILAKSNTWEKALILTALNCAFYPIDCQRLEWSMINFSKGTVRFDRIKATGRTRGAVPRVAVLWKRTLQLLKKLNRQHTNLFISDYKRPVHIETIRRHWRSLCKKAGIKRRITFANLRDSALTAAAESTDPVVPVQQYHVLAGHVAKGVDDSYITRHPRFVETATQAIENCYFPRKPRRAN